MPVVRRTKEPGKTRGQANLVRMGKTYQLDIGFGNNLAAFKEGRRDDIRSVLLGEALARICARERVVSLVMGLGAGNLQGTGEWCDLTALGHDTTLFLEAQGLDTTPFHYTQMPNAIRAQGDAGKREREAPKDFEGMTVYPIAQFLLATNEWVGAMPDEQLYFGEVTENAPFRQVIEEARREIEPGKCFALIAGKFGEAVFRPLKPEGPRQGRPFDTSRSDDADVVWIPGKGAFDGGYIIASIDDQSYTVVHAHTFVPGLSRYEGHIEEANVRGGTADIMIVKAHELVSAD